MYSSSVIPLYSYNENTKKYKSVGSAVKILHRSQLFLITAAHVIESLKGKRVFIYFEKIFYEIGGFTAYLSNCSLYPSRNDDPFDLAAILLPKKIESSCDHNKFITIGQYLAGDFDDSPFFQAIGYPHSKNTKAVNKTVRIPGEFRPEGFRYTVTDVSSNAFPYKNFNIDFHIATCLTKTGVSQCSHTPINIPDLHGISGGLLQKVSLYNPTTDGFDIAYPAGIILEKKRDNSAFFSLRLSAVFKWLDLHWEYFQPLAQLNQCKLPSQPICYTLGSPSSSITESAKEIKGGITIPIFDCIFHENESIESFRREFDEELYAQLPNLYVISVAKNIGREKRIVAGFFIKTSYTHHDKEFSSVVSGAFNLSEKLHKFAGSNISFLPARLGVVGRSPPTEMAMLKVMLEQFQKHSFGISPNFAPKPNVPSARR